MKFLFVYRELSPGGIETFIVRFSNWLVGNGHAVTLIATGGSLLKDLSEEVSTERYSTWDRGLYSRKGALAFVKDRSIEGIDVVLSFDADSTFVGLLLLHALRRCGEEPLFVTGVYHPHAYYLWGRRHWRSLLERAVLRRINPRSVFFMNQECRDSHTAYTEIDYSRSLIFPPPINPPTLAQRERARTRQILSLGRLVNFKAYNLGMVDVLRELREEGHDVTWRVYGDGDIRYAVTARAKDAGLEGSVAWEPVVDYADLPAVFAEADVFVGMGIAALESASHGVPSISSIMWERDASYGYVYELPFGNVGEEIEGREKKKILDLVRNLLEMDDAQYLEESRRSIECAKLYSLDSLSPDFIAYLEANRAELLSTEPISPRATWLYRVLTERHRQYLRVVGLFKTVYGKLRLLLAG